jgi:NADH-quinone oxidoreductase subunit L
VETIVTFLRDPGMLAILAACFPLLTFLELSFFGKPGKGAVAAVGNAWLCLLLSAYLFCMVWNKGEVHSQVTWFTVGEIRFTAGILLNNLSALMLLLVSLVSLLVHVFSVSYMKHEAEVHRYWSYLGIFCFSMMLLVVVDNLLLIYFCWELVGMSSYLLIGFWTTRDRAAAAAKKAFVMNRIGDLGFLTGIVILYTQFHTLDITSLLGGRHLFENTVVANGQWISSVNALPAGWLTVAGTGFFLGAMSKSAQFPLHTWLPDAMEGPTPVSSLIHAATMVAAGVFLLVRIFPVFNPDALTVIAFTGAVTAFFAATCAMVQYDIKKVLAWSTISQLGLMMLAVGMGATGQAIVHLTAHAFFKCLLFLAAGSVIHALQHANEASGSDLDPQDIRNMGGLRRKMPVTFSVMLIAAASLAGLPFTSGYLSKDAILVHVLALSGEDGGGMGFILSFLAFTSSLMTVFYIARLMFSVFFGPAERENGAIHDPGLLMKWPMIVLALCCFYPLFTGSWLPEHHSWLMAAVDPPRSVESDERLTWVPVALTLASLLMISCAWLLYGRKRLRSTPVLRPAGRFLLEGWRIDRLYQYVFIGPALSVSKTVFRIDRMVLDGIIHRVASAGVALARIAGWFDVFVIDALVNFMGALSKSIGNFVRRFQSGKVQHYLLFTLTVLLLFFILSYFSW